VYSGNLVGIIRTGFYLGLGDPSNQQCLTYYYCFRTEYPRVKLEEIKDHERELRWRVFYKEPARAGYSFFKPMVFTDLIDWLEFYQNWWERESVDYAEWRAGNLERLKFFCPSGHEKEDDPVEKSCYESPMIKDLFKHSAKDEPPTMMEDSRLSTVVEAYRQKMTASHRALFSGRIKYLENDKSLAEK
jgi:hypothetical protein